MEFEVTYFLPDKLKDGGAYVTTQGHVRRIDEYAKTIVFIDRTRIGLNTISDVKVIE